MKFRIFLVVLVLTGLGAGYVCIRFYSYVFAKKVEGVVTGVERVTQANAVFGRATDPSQIYSFAIAIRNKEGEIFTASSEDRQWAVVRAGQCAEAEFFPYPFWEFDKAGTFFGARLLKLKDCKSENGAPPLPAAGTQPTHSATPSPSPS